MKITATDLRCEREPLVRPFGFKGGYLTELWQSVVRLESEAGHFGIGLGTQSVLWSDASVFSSHSEREGNELMLSLTRKALELARGRDCATPFALLEEILPEVLAHGRELTGRANLRPTFALNALVAIDNAAWVLFARENGFSTFDDAVPAAYRGGIPAHHERSTMIPLLSYGTSFEEVRQLVAAGAFFFKIKIGHPGTQTEMLAQDCARVSALHAILKDVRTVDSVSGRVCYYFDANGRYADKETLLRFIDHLQKIGAYGQTVLIEEPFDETNETDVREIPLRLCADESAHTVEDALRRMDLGYRALALKPIAKTLSMSLRIAAEAAKRGVPCFCADLTVNPVLVAWNRAVAERLPQFPGIGDLGLFESNGAQNYRNWERMCADVPAGGLFAPMPRLEGLFET